MSPFQKIDVDPFSKALYGADKTIIGYKVALDTELAQGYPKREKAREWGFYHFMFCAFVKIVQSNKRMIPLFPWKLLVLLLGFQGDFWGNC